MKKALTITAIVLGGLVLLGGMAYFGLRGTVRYIIAQRDCSWFIIDNIELHTRINIPDLKGDMDCTYNKEQNAKTARFEINTEDVDMDNYISRNEFRKIQSLADVPLDELLSKEQSLQRAMGSPDLYYTSGAHKGETWQGILDKTTGTLWVLLRYRD